MTQKAAMGPATESTFKDAMLPTYYESAKLGYTPTYFLRMVHELGAVETAKRLIHVPKFSTGFTKLWELKRLDLSVEALVIQPQWQGLFDENDRKVAQDKLNRMIAEGVKVRHRQKDGVSFGEGVVLRVNQAANTALVKWTNHVSEGGMAETDVNLDTLDMIF